MIIFAVLDKNMRFGGRKVKRNIITILITVIIISVMWQMSPKRDSETTYNVNIVYPQRKNIYDYINASGRIKEGNCRDIYPDSVIEVKTVFVKIGDNVKKGDILAEFESIKLDDTHISDYGIGTEEVISVFREYGMDFDISQIETVNTDSGEILSPIDGTITDVKVKPGDRVNPLKKLFSVSDFSDLYVSAMVPEGYSSKVEKGQKVEISAEAFNEKVYKGTVSEISPVAKKQASLTGEGETYIEATIALEKTDRLIKPELNVNAKISANVVNYALTIPYDCILQDEENREYVYLAENGSARKQYVYLGYELESEAEVKGGVDDTSKVIKNPVPGMEYGKISITE